VTSQSEELFSFFN